MKAVVVVPILAPIITINPWDRLKRSAQINATTIAVTPEEDWINVVAIIPVISALNLLPVVFFNKLFSFSLFNLIKELRIKFRPNRNKVNPPTTSKT